MFKYCNQFNLKLLLDYNKLQLATKSTMPPVVIYHNSFHDIYEQSVDNSYVLKVIEQCIAYFNNISYSYNSSLALIKNRLHINIIPNDIALINITSEYTKHILKLDNFIIFLSFISKPIFFHIKNLLIIMKKIIINAILEPIKKIALLKNNSQINIKKILVYVVDINNVVNIYTCLKNCLEDLLLCCYEELLLVRNPLVNNIINTIDNDFMSVANKIRIIDSIINIDLNAINRLIINKYWITYIKLNKEMADIQEIIQDCIIKKSKIIQNKHIKFIKNNSNYSEIVNKLEIAISALNIVLQYYFEDIDDIIILISEIMKFVTFLTTIKNHSNSIVERKDYKNRLKRYNNKAWLSSICWCID